MKKMLAFVFAISCTSAFSQTQFFLGTNGEYVILLDSTTVRKTENYPNGTYLDVFSIKMPSGAKALLTIRKAGETTESPETVRESFMKVFAAECECQLIEVGKRPFQNFTGFVFKIERTNGEREVYGYSVALVSSGSVFNLNLLGRKTDIQELDSTFVHVTKYLMFK